MGPGVGKRKALTIGKDRSSNRRMKKTSTFLHKHLSQPQKKSKRNGKRDTICLFCTYLLLIIRFGTVLHVFQKQEKNIEMENGKFNLL